MGKGSASEASINRTLAALRDMAEDGKRMEAGHLVAILPASEGFRLNEVVANSYPIAAGSAGQHIELLVRAGLVQPGVRRTSIPRWVRLHGSFSYDKLPES